ncbi:MAG: hypothetical protein U0Q11_16585 [Vicinamibacterales bacterium]
MTLTAQNIAAWSPCAVVHNPGGAPFNTQMDAVSKLQRAGKLQWMRLDTHLDGSGSEITALRDRWGCGRCRSCR